MLKILLVTLFIAHLAQAKTKPSVTASTPIPEPDKPKELSYPIPPLSEGGAGDQVTVLTLEGSIERAIEQASAVQRAKFSQDLSGVQLIQGYAQFLPNLALTGTSNRIRGEGYLTTTIPTYVQTDTHGAAYQLSSTLNLFNGLADVSGLKSAMARSRAADMSLLRAKQQIALDIQQSFLQIVLDKEIVRISSKNLASSQAREALLKEQARVGVRTLADLYRQEALTSSDESFLENSQNKERTDELLLLRKLLLDPSQRYEIRVAKYSARATFDPDYASEGKMIDLALKQRPDLRAQEDTANAALWDLRGSRAGFLPKLDFGVAMSGTSRWLDSQNVTGVGNVVPASQDDLDYQLRHQVEYTVGFTLTWNIFDRWSTRLGVERASVAYRNSDLDLQDLRNQVIGEVRQIYGDYRSVLQQAESSSKGLVAAEKAYEVVKGRYEVGAANFVDLTTAQAALVQAEGASVQAEISLALQKRILDTVTGTAKMQ